MQKKRRVFRYPAVLIALGLAGCAQSRDEEDEALRRALPRFKAVLQAAARSFLTGQAYDRTVIAARNSDDAALSAAQQELRLIDPRLAAEQAVQSAVRLEMLAQRESDKQRAARLQEQAAAKYREALALAPDFDSSDPDLLNALGYFLAERGTSASDFVTAEKLTRRSLEIWNEIVSNTESSWIPGTSTLLANQKFVRALTARDSLAWALFRQGKYAEAKNQQETAVREVEANAAAAGQPMSADLYYHLGEIYRALKQPEKARGQFQKALKAQPDHELTLRALKKMPARPRRSTPAAPPETRPKTPSEAGILTT